MLPLKSKAAPFARSPGYKYCVTHQCHCCHHSERSEEAGNRADNVARTLERGRREKRVLWRKNLPSRPLFPSLFFSPSMSHPPPRVFPLATSNTSSRAWIDREPLPPSLSHSLSFASPSRDRTSKIIISPPTLPLST